MPIRIYDIAQELGVDSHTVLAKAKELGINAKVSSSSLDKITADYVREKVRASLPAPGDARHLVGDARDLQLQSGPLPPAAARPWKSEQSITIRLNGSEFYEKVRSGDIDVVVEVAEKEGAPPIKLRLVPDIGLRLRSTVEAMPRVEVDERAKDLFRAAYYASRHNSTEEWVNLADYGNALKKLEPAFKAEQFGERSLGSILRRLTDVFEIRADESNPIVYYVRTRQESPRSRAGNDGPEGAVSLNEALSAAKLSATAKGKIHNLKLGFGFIAPDDGSENLFFHATEVVGCTIFDLHPGDVVEFEPGVNERGLCARKVRRLERGVEESS